MSDIARSPRPWPRWLARVSAVLWVLVALFLCYVAVLSLTTPGPVVFGVTYLLLWAVLGWLGRDSWRLRRR